MIVRKPRAEKLLGRPLAGRKASYYVLSEKKPHRNLGGPYNKEGAERRLCQVEYFKRRK